MTMRACKDCKHFHRTIDKQSYCCRYPYFTEKLGNDMACGEFAPIESEAAQAFDAEKVQKIARGLFNLASKAYSNNMGKGDIYWKSYEFLHIELLAALGIDE